MARVRVAGGGRRVEPVDIGEQHQDVCPDHGGDAGGETVVVAVADLAGRDRVVLVDHRHGADFEELEHRGAGIEVAAALLGVLRRHQDLAGRNAVMAERLSPVARQGDLPHGGGGLALLQPERAWRVAEHRPPQSDGARRNHEDIHAPRMQIGDVLGESREPGMAQATARAVDEKRRADLDDDAAKILKDGDLGQGGLGRRGHGTGV